MRHTEFTLRNFSGFAVVIFLISTVSVSFGAVDLLMVAPKGIEHVAAVGQGDLIIIGLFAFFGGFVDVFSSKLAMAEGRGESARRLPVLVGALLLTAAVCALIAALVAVGIGPFLRLTGQDPELVPLVEDYTSVRLYSVALLIVYVAISEALKISGLKNVTFTVLVIGFGANAGLNWLFLYGPPSGGFSSPESAVATATVVAQALMAACSLTVFLWQMGKRGKRFERPKAAEVRTEFLAMMRVGPGIGVRHLNDYMGSIIPMMFVGLLGVQALAAYALAAKIYTIICRVPQSCVTGTFVFYSYAVGRETPPDELKRKAGTMLLYTAVPTLVSSALVVVFSSWLVRFFSDGTVDIGLAQAMLFGFMATVPLYILEASYGELLTVHQRGGLLSLSSTLTTWFIMIPLAIYGVVVLKSGPLAIALGGVVATAVQVWIFWRALHKTHWTVARNQPAEVPVV
jgi:multidrug resistance protein, MATE family